MEASTSSTLQRHPQRLAQEVIQVTYAVVLGSPLTLLLCYNFCPIVSCVYGLTLDAIVCAELLSLAAWRYSAPSDSVSPHAPRTLRPHSQSPETMGATFTLIL